MTSQDRPPPYDHQREAVACALAADKLGRPGVYLNHVVGAGKTRTALGIAKARQAKRVLVLAPLVALGVWQREVKKWWPGAGAQILRGIDEPGGYTPLVACINYDLLNAARVKWLLDWKPELLICDESHFCKGPTTQRTRWTTKLAQKIPFRVLLSGTPAHTPLDWWTQMRLVCDPNDPVWAQRFSAYRNQVGILGGPHQNWVKGFREDVVDEVVKQHVLPYTHVVSRDQLKLPEPVESIIPFDLDATEQACYVNVEKEMLLVPPNGGESELVTHVFAKLTKMRQIASGFFLQGMPAEHYVAVGGSKLGALQELLSARPNHNVVISCHFTISIRVARQAFPDARVIDGSTPADERTSICDWFQAPGRGKIVILQEQAGGVAITLSKADTLVFYEVPVSGVTFEQMRGRIDRPGKPDFQEILVLAANSTLEEELYTSVKAKLDTVSLARRLLEKARESHA